MALKISIFLILVNSLAARAAAPQKLELDRSGSEVRFTAVGKPSLLRIKGESAHPSGSLVESAGTYTGDIIVDLNDFSTGISLRDKHMKEKYLETGRPENAKADLKVAKLDASCVNEAAGSAKPCPFSGTLTLHGKTQPVTGLASVENASGGKRISAEWTLKLTDYGIEVPQFAGVTVADEVKIEADAKVMEKAQ